MGQHEADLKAMSEEVRSQTDCSGSLSMRCLAGLPCHSSRKLEMSNKCWTIATFKNSLSRQIQQ